MTTYTATFRTDADFATLEIKAATPEQALKKARRFYDNDPFDLMFESYDGGMPVNEIAICNREGEELIAWVSDDLRLRLAAQDLLDALRLAVEALNTAPRFAVRGRDLDSYEVATQCDRAIRTATEGGAA